MKKYIHAAGWVLVGMVQLPSKEFAFVPRVLFNFS
jgi:hypothetical protein